MNMSLMLHVLLWLFPHSFAQRFGDQWMSTVEDGLADARSRGRTAWAKAWGRLLADTAIQVPKAHAMASSTLVFPWPVFPPITVNPLSVGA